MQNSVLMGSPHSSLTDSTWYLWIDAESGAHGFPMFHSQEVRDLVGSMQNRVLMESPCFLPTACTWSRWIDAELCVHGISPFFTHRKYVISLDRCRIVCSSDFSFLHSQAVCDLVASIPNLVLMQSPRSSPTGSTWSTWIDTEFCAYGVFSCFTHR